MGSDTEFFQRFDWRKAMRFLERMIEGQEVRLRPPKVLYIDDDTNDIFLFRSVFDKFHAELTVTSNVEEASSLYRSGRWDLVFVDYKMPKMDGIEFLKATIHESPQTGFIAVSGYGDNEVINKILRLGATFIGKPITEQALISCGLRFKPNEPK